jgi:hypothetical protein
MVLLPGCVCCCGPYDDYAILVSAEKYNYSTSPTFPVFGATVRINNTNITPGFQVARTTSEREFGFLYATNSSLTKSAIASSLSAIGDANLTRIINSSDTVDQGSLPGLLVPGTDVTQQNVIGLTNVFGNQWEVGRLFVIGFMSGGSSPKIITQDSWFWGGVFDQQVVWDSVSSFLYDRSFFTFNFCA